MMDGELGTKYCIIFLYTLWRPFRARPIHDMETKSQAQVPLTPGSVAPAGMQAVGQDLTQ